MHSDLGGILERLFLFGRGMKQQWAKGLPEPRSPQIIFAIDIFFLQPPIPQKLLQNLLQSSPRIKIESIFFPFLNPPPTYRPRGGEL